MLLNQLYLILPLDLDNCYWYQAVLVVPVNYCFSRNNTQKGPISYWNEDKVDEQKGVSEKKNITLFEKWKLKYSKVK